MKIYVASSRKLIRHVETVAAVLEGKGHEITYKWWIDVSLLGPDDTKVPRDVLADCAWRDCNAVYEADLVWLLAPEEGGTGCWVELGMAMMNAPDRGIIVSGAHTRTLFTFIKDIKLFTQHEDALQHILHDA